MEELEMKKIMEQRKREKEEEKQARNRVKQLIEADKLARKNKQAGEAPAAAPPVTVIPSPTVSVTPKDYTETKIQVCSSLIWWLIFSWTISLII